MGQIREFWLGPTVGPVSGLAASPRGLPPHWYAPTCVVPRGWSGALAPERRDREEASLDVITCMVSRPCVPHDGPVRGSRTGRPARCGCLTRSMPAQAGSQAASVRLAVVRPDLEP